MCLAVKASVDGAMQWTNLRVSYPNYTLFLFSLSIHELVDEESKLIVNKSINGLAPWYTCNLFTRKFFGNYHRLRNTAIDLKAPKKMSNNG